MLKTLLQLQTFISRAVSYWALNIFLFKWRNKSIESNFKRPKPPTIHNSKVLFTNAVGINLHINRKLRCFNIFLNVTFYSLLHIKNLSHIVQPLSIIPTRAHRGEHSLDSSESKYIGWKVKAKNTSYNMYTLYIQYTWHLTEMIVLCRKH